MNQETRMQDAEAVSREVRLEVRGLEGQGEGDRPQACTLRIVNNLLPLAQLMYDSTPDRSILLTAREHDKNYVEKDTAQVMDPGFLPQQWIPLDLQADRSDVCMRHSLVLVMEGESLAVWYQAPDAPEEGVIAPGLKRISLAEGLLGLTEWTEFLLQHEESDPVGVLMPLALHSVPVTVVDPFQVLPDYQPGLTEGDLKALGVSRQEDLAWLSILNIQNDPFRASANLLGPIVYHPASGIGKQVVLSSSGYPASYPLGQAVSEEGR